MHAYMHAQFAALMTLSTTEPRRIPIVSCALIYDTAIRVSAVTADRTGKFALLTYSLTAYHCSFDWCTISTLIRLAPGAEAKQKHASGSLV